MSLYSFLSSYISRSCTLDQLEKSVAFRRSLLIDGKVEPGEWLFKHDNIVFAGVKFPKFELPYLNEGMINRMAFSVQPWKILQLDKDQLSSDAQTELILIDQLKKFLITTDVSTNTHLQDLKSIKKIPVGFYIYTIERIENYLNLFGPLSTSYDYLIRGTIMYQYINLQKYRDEKIKQVIEPQYNGINYSIHG